MIILFRIYCIFYSKIRSDNKLRLLLPLSIGFIIFILILVSFINALSIPLAITGLQYYYVFAFYYYVTRVQRLNVI